MKLMIITKLVNLKVLEPGDSFRELPPQQWEVMDSITDS